MSPSRFLAGAAALGVAFIAAPGAAETTRQFLVTAAIVNGCAITNTAAGNWGAIDFGTVSGLATGSVDASLLSGSASGLRIECTPGTTVSLTADNGDHAASGQRRLAQAGVATAVPYALYANGSATPWTTQAVAIAFPAGATTQAVPLRGRATLPGALPAGRYSDTVRITVAW